MDIVVVDASVAVKWLVVEQGTPEARRLLADAVEERVRLIAPALIEVEVANAIWSRQVFLSQTPVAGVHDLWDSFRSAPLIRTNDDGLVTESLLIACRLGKTCTIYDATYIVCAMHNDCGLVTADAAQAKAAREFLAADDVTLIR